MGRPARGIFAVSLAAALTLTAGASLGSESFDCEVTPLTRSSWMPEQILFHFNRSYVNAQVEDKLSGRSETADVSRFSLMSVVLTWTEPAEAARSPRKEHPEWAAPPLPARLFRVVMNLENLKVSVQVGAERAGSGLIRGAGGCTRLPGNETAARPRRLARAI